VFGAAIVYVNQSRLRDGIDDDLVHQARLARNGPPHRPPPPPRRADDPNPRLGNDPDPMGPLGDGPPGRRGPDSGGPDFGPPGQPPPDPFAASGRIADVRRPRFFNLSLHPMDPRETFSPFDADGAKEALAGHANFRTISYNGESVRLYSQPIDPHGHVDGVVQFARELTDLDLLWAAQLRTLALMLPLAVLAAAGAAYLLTGRTLRPVLRITQAAAEIGKSRDLARRLEVTGDDEMAELARTFNAMIGRLAESFTALETAYAKLQDAYGQQQRFTADASHELRTPLTRLRLATSAALAPSATGEDRLRALETADRAAVAMSRLVQQLLTLAKVDAGELGLHLEPVDLRVVVAEGLDEVTTEREIQCSFADTPLMIAADSENLRRVVVNLLENALRHTPASGCISLSAEKVPDGRAVIVVRDTGEGIAPEHLPHIFERFYRADAARNRKDGGSGLGLAITKNLVEAHGGRLEIESKLCAGTTVRAFFPLFSERKPTQTNSS